MRGERLVVASFGMSLRKIVNIEWDVLSNVETAKSYVVAIILHHAFLRCCAISAQYNCMLA